MGELDCGLGLRMSGGGEMGVCDNGRDREWVDKEME